MNAFVPIAACLAAAGAMVTLVLGSEETEEFKPIIEAELPRDFPEPIDVGEIAVKQYPEYRMARASMRSGSAFWTLFRHIKRNDIAMTAPVELGYRTSEGESSRESSMAFLYGDPQLGAAGNRDGVEVIDVPAMSVVSLGMRGGRDASRIAEARDRLQAWLDEHADAYAADGELRVLAYNSPFVPRDRRYFEVQIPIREI